MALLVYLVSVVLAIKVNVDSFDNFLSSLYSYASDVYAQVTANVPSLSEAGTWIHAGVEGRVRPGLGLGGSGSLQPLADGEISLDCFDIKLTFIVSSQGKVKAALA